MPEHLHRTRRGQGLDAGSRAFAALLLAIALGAPAGAQSPQGPAGDSGAPRRIGDPYEAYDQGSYEQALQGFVDQQVERPEDPAVAFNIGSAQYKLKDYQEAERHFATAALSADPKLRQQALYNLGNVAFRQGRLEDAVERFKAALEIDPDDQDAKFNLEFVRDEIRRRNEEAQKRQQDQDKDQQQNQDQQNQDQQNQDQQDQQGDQGQQDQQGDQDQQQGQQGQDSDRDGLPDQAETQAQNPTDPNNPDSDGDGLRDGQEDKNGNGQVDAGETDPNNPDSDGDGVPDGAEEQAQQGQQNPAQEPQTGAEDGQPGQAVPSDAEGLTEEEAERYLQALEEVRPKPPEDTRRGRRGRPEKDW